MKITTRLVLEILVMGLIVTFLSPRVSRVLDRIL